MPEEEFLQITPRSFSNKLTGFRRKQDFATRESWEQTRALGVLLLSPNLKKGVKADAEKIWPLPWDKKSMKPKDSPEEALEKVESFWKEIDEKRNNKIE